MKRKILTALTLASLFAAISTCLVACADDSLPNRRGIERATLTGNSGTNNAYNRENEAPKRELPTGGEKEFPGQSLAPQIILPGDQPVVYLAEINTDAAIKPAEATATTASSTAPATSEPAQVMASPAKALPSKSPRINDNGAVAIPGKDIPVPATGMVIPADWGNPVVVDNLPHRDWSKSELTYVDGVVYQNPVYFHDLLDHGDRANGTYLGTPAGYVKDWLELPWFYAEVAALPVYMVCQPPLSQKSTRTHVPEAIYNGKVPENGPIVPSPTPGKVEFIYPATTLPSDSK